MRVDGADGPAQLAEGEAVGRPVEPGREARARVDELQVPCGVAAALDEVRLVRGRVRDRDRGRVRVRVSLGLG